MTYFTCNIISIGLIAYNIIMIYSSEEGTSPDMSKHMIIGLLSSLYSTIIIPLSKRLMINSFIEGLQLDKEIKDLSLSLEQEKKIKVTYPLFLKKSQNNMFSRALKDDFKNRDMKKIEQHHSCEESPFKLARKVQNESEYDPGMRILK